MTTKNTEVFTIALTCMAKPKGAGSRISQYSSSIMSLCSSTPSARPRTMPMTAI